MNQVMIKTPPHKCTMESRGECKACNKWLEYQKAWYWDLEHNFPNIHWSQL